MEKIRIRNAAVYDPSQGWRGELRELDLANGRVCRPSADPDRVIDAGGRPVLAGGIEPCCWAAAPGLALFRGLAGFPSPEDIGRTYARLGYVHMHHPFTGLLTARLTRRGLDLIPYVDTSTCAAVDLRDLGPVIRANRFEDFRRQARGLIRAAGALGVVLPFPHLRHRERQHLQKNLSSGKVLSFLSRLEDPDLLPVHLWASPEILHQEIPGADRFHLCGLAAALRDPSSLERAAAFLDAGGSADLGLGTGRDELAVESASGMEPGTLSLDTGLASTLQWRVRSDPAGSISCRAGWKLLARAKPSWRLALGAAGPAGGRPGSLGEAAAWLLAPAWRPPELRGLLPGFSFDLEEYALRTRLQPARILGFDDLGHLGVGARACVAIYDLAAGAGGADLARASALMPDDDLPPGAGPVFPRAALRECWCLIKDGVPVREEGRFTGRLPPRRTRTRDLEANAQELARTEAFQSLTVRAENLWVDD